MKFWGQDLGFRVGVEGLGRFEVVCGPAGGHLKHAVVAILATWVLKSGSEPTIPKP